MLPDNDKSRLLSAVSQAIKVSHQGEHSLARPTRVIREHFQADACVLYDLHEGNFSLISSDASDFAALNRIPAENQERLLELVLQKKELVLAGDDGTALPKDGLPLRSSDKAARYAAAPLIFRNEMVGAMILQMREGAGFPPHEDKFLQFLALQLAGVVQNLAAMDRAKKLSPKGPKQRILKGIGVSAGLGIGPAVMFRPGLLSVNLRKEPPQNADPKGEGDKLRIALDTASGELHDLEKKLSQDLAQNESKIFQSHRMILSDPDFLQRLSREIRHGKTALQAISWVIEGFMNQLKDARGPRWEEAVVDLEELRQRTLEKLLEFRSPGGMEEWSGILVSPSLGPSDTLRLNPKRLLGIATMGGGPTSHAAILARSLGIPAVMAVPGLLENIHVGDLLIVDGDNGEVIVNPNGAVLEDYELREKNQLERIVDFDAIAYESAVTLDGHEISLEANVGFASDLNKLRLFGAEGVGLFRTEYLFLDRKKLPNEPEQYELYRRAVTEADGLPLTFRVLDAGGDKPVAALDMPKESNPFLGCRSLRLLLSRPEILRTQLRALLRASAHGKIRLLLPMVSGVEEIQTVKKMIADVQGELSRENVDFDAKLPLGIMIEIPAAVHLAPVLARLVDFLSIGTNDLIQYTLAVDRNNERVAEFFESYHPAVISSIAQVAAAGRAANKPVSVCGEMASEPLAVPLLVGLGISSLSMIPSAILRARKIIRELNFENAGEMAGRALQATTVLEVKDILQEFQDGL